MINLKKIVRILLGALFMLSSIAKLSSMEGFELYIFSFGFASFDLCSFAARFVVIAEFVMGLGLASGQYHRFFRILTALVLFAFSLFLLWRAAIGDTESCHCMGDVVDMNPVQSLLKNLFLGVLLFFSWTSEPRQWKCRKIALISACAVSTAATFAVTPPDVFYRVGRTSDDLSVGEFKPVADSLGLSEGRKVICFYSAGCEHCRHSAAKMAGIIRRNGLSPESFPVVFMQTHENQDSVSVAFFKEFGEGLVLPSSYLHPYSFLPLTNGSMPLVVLFEDGNLIKEYDYISINEKEISEFINE